jgi:signal transduction histidine kinase
VRRFRTLRGRLTAFAVIAAIAAIAVLTLAFNIVLDRSLDSDARGRLRTEAAAVATTVSASDGHVQVKESPWDGEIDQRIWVFDGTRAVEHPNVPRRLQLAAAGLAGRGPAFEDVPGADVRLYATPIDVHGRQVGTVVASLSLEPYHRTIDLSVLASIGLAGLLVAAVCAGTWITIGRALAPVHEMTASAAAWSEHDVGRRFGPEPRPGELGELAATFDGLLDRLAASLRHEQRLSAELSHELRTPLARIVAEVELLRRRERPIEERRDAHAVIDRSARQMDRILETLMAAARAEVGSESRRSDLATAFGHLGAAWTAALGDRGVALEIVPPDGPLPIGVDAEFAERILAPLLDNAVRYATSRVTVSAARTRGGVVIVVADDGPGVPAETTELVFEPGRQGGSNGHAGAGLGLALARRLARAVGGDITLDAAAPRGARFRVELPA